MNKGASLRDRAVAADAVEPLRVSALRASIPSAEPDLDAALSRLGERLRERRKALKMSLDAVADRSGLTKSYIWEIENGKNKNPTIRTAWKLARALGWTLSECIGIWEHTDLLDPAAMRVAVHVDQAIREARVQGIETRRAETVGLGAKHESPVPEGDAP